MTEPIETNLSIIGGSSSPQDGTNNRFYASAYPTLNAAISAIGATEGTLIIDQACSLTANTTIPTTLSTICYKTGIITASNSATLTINGPFAAGMFQCFSGFGTSDVTFGQNSLKEVHPEWFGAIADNSTDSGAAINKAIQASGTGQTVKFGAGTYLSSVRIILKEGRSYIGVHKQSSVIKQKDGSNLLLGFVVSEGWANDAAATDDVVVINNIAIDGNFTNNASSTATCLILTNYYSLIDGIAINQSPYDGIALQNTGISGGTMTGTALETVFNDCWIHNSNNYGFYSNGVSDCKIQNCNIGLSDKDGIYVDDAFGWLVSDNIVYGNGENGIYMNKGGQVTVVGNQVRRYGKVAASGSYAGIYVVSNENGSRISSVQANNIFDDVTTGIGGSYGIRIAAGSAATVGTYIHVVGNSLNLSGAEIGIYCSGSGVLNAEITGNAITGVSALGELSSVASGTIRHYGNDFDNKIQTISTAAMSVLQGHRFKTNTGPSTISTFNNGYPGQTITMLFLFDSWVVDFTGTDLIGNAGSDWRPKVGDFMECTYDGTSWYCKVFDAAI